jgi:hypothetical protein
VLQIHIECDIHDLSLESRSLPIGSDDDENVNVGIRLCIAPRHRTEQAQVDQGRPESCTETTGEIGNGRLPAGIERRHRV